MESNSSTDIIYSSSPWPLCLSEEEKKNNKIMPKNKTALYRKLLATIKESGLCILHFINDDIGGINAMFFFHTFIYKGSNPITVP